MPTTDVLVVIGKPRSGTTVFREMLGSHPAILDFGEIFNENHPDSIYSFFVNKVASDSKWAYPSRASKLFHAYADFNFDRALEWKPSTRTLIFDVKYDHLRLLQDGWGDLNRLPAILNEVHKANWRVFHLVRRETAAAVLSNLIAQVSGVYHLHAAGFDPSASREKTKFKVNIDEFIHFYSVLIAEVNQVDAWLGFIGNTLRLDYETMFDSSGLFSEHLLDSVSKFLGVENSFDRKPKLVKVITGDPFSYVENGDELRFALEARLAAQST